MTNPKAKSQTFANFSPPEEDFDPLAFQKWLAKGGRDYLQLDPYTSDGLKGVLKFNGISSSEIRWDDTELPLLYAHALTLVQRNGRHDNWTISAEEGLHRLTGSVIRTLACKLDVDNAVVRPNTIGAQDFIDNDVANPDKLQTYEMDAATFRKTIYESTFNYKKKKEDEPDPSKTRLVNASVTYFKKGGVNGCEASYHLRTRSYATSVNKKNSVIRCPLDLMGEFIGKFISNITVDQATRRVDFDKVNPSNVYKKEVRDYNNELTKHDEDFNKAFPMADVLQHEHYRSYLEDPLGDGKLEKAMDLFKFKPLKDEFHVPPDSEALEEVKKRSTPPFIRPPFLPSIASNEIDVGMEFSKKCKFNPDTVNAAILAPTVYAYIMSAYTGKPMREVINDTSRIKHLNYYLRFHNSHGDCSPIKKVHAAFNGEYQQSYDAKGFGLCYKSTVMLGMLDFVLTMFNSYLSIEAENVIQNKWEEREAHFKNMAIEFGAVFSNIGNTGKVAGRDYSSVISVLGTIFYDLDNFFHFVNFQPII